MRQRVSIARAFANDPEVLLMDEPFSALDEQNRTILQQELLRIWETDKKTVVFITHSVDEAVTLADKIMVMTASPGRARTVLDVSLERRATCSSCANDPRYGQIVYGIWGISRTRSSGRGYRSCCVRSLAFPGRALSAFTRVFDALRREPGSSANSRTSPSAAPGSRLFARCARSAGTRRYRHDPERSCPTI